MNYIDSILKHTVYSTEIFNNELRLRRELQAHKANVVQFVRSDGKFVICIDTQRRVPFRFEENGEENIEFEPYSAHICEIRVCNISRITFADTDNKCQLDITNRNVFLFSNTDNIHHKNSLLYKCPRTDFSEEDFFNMGLMCSGFLTTYEEMKYLCDNTIQKLHKENIRVSYKVNEIR